MSLKKTNIKPHRFNKKKQDLRTIDGIFLLYFSSEVFGHLEGIFCTVLQFRYGLIRMKDPEMLEGQDSVIYRGSLSSCRKRKIKGDKICKGFS